VDLVVVLQKIHRAFADATAAAKLTFCMLRLIMQVEDMIRGEK
jgi:hypothetical protein